MFLTFMERHVGYWRASQSKKFATLQREVTPATSEPVGMLSRIVYALDLLSGRV
jgi:hypothetical protein